MKMINGINSIFPKVTIVVICFLLVLASCKKWIDPGLNKDPNNPDEVPMSVLLPAIEARMAFTIIGGNDIVRVQSMWIQQLDGTAHRSIEETYYKFGPEDVNGLWEEVYAGCLADIKAYLDLAEKVGSNHNRGVGKILQAHLIGAASDVWNDIPWTEALKGTGNFSPAFDSQESIYNSVISLLADGINDLEAQDASGVPILGDYLFSGNPGKWIRAAHSLIARYLLHLSGRDESMYPVVLEHIDSGIASNKEDMQFNYGTGASESNPLYQFMRDHDDVRMNAFLINMLSDRHDPRLTVLAEKDENGMYSGSVTGTGNTRTSRPGPAIASANAPTYFVTYMEMMLDKAICLYHTGAAEDDVKDALLSGMAASLEKYGVYSNPYFNDYRFFIQALSGEELLNEIVVQKYISLCYQSEAYNDWRRTGNSISIPANPNGVEPEIPRRFPYASDELLYNPNTPKGIGITERVWWDGK